MTLSQAQVWRQWVWPAPIWYGREPYVSDGFQQSETEDHRQHLGVDLVYRRLPNEPATLPRGGKRSYVPENAPALAAFRGEIWSARKTPRGHFVVISHGNIPGVGPVTTSYQHLLSFSKPWQKGDAVKTGEELGLIGGDLPPNYTLYHLHFELWFPKKGVPAPQWLVDPYPYMRRYWSMVRKPDRAFS